MRKRSLLALAGTVAAVSLTVAVPASAATAVLSAGGSDLPSGSTITAPLVPNATFYSSATGTSGVKCSSGSFTATVGTNPAAPGTAGLSVTALPFAGCTSNVTGVTGVNSITVALPTPGTVSSDGTVTVGPIQATISLKTLLGNISCVYTAGSITGTAANADHSITFTNQPFSKSSGSSLCFSTAYFSAKYAPVTSGGVPVDVN